MKESNNLKKRSRNKVVKVIVTVVSGVGLFVALLLLIIVLSGLNSLRNPVSGLLPIVAAGALIAGLVILLVGLWRKGERLFSKVVLSGLGIVVVALFLFAVSPVVNNQIIAETFRTDIKSMKAYAARDVTYDIPSGWYTNNVDGDTYYYPSGTDSPSLGMVAVGEREGIWIFSDKMFINNAYNKMTETIKSEGSDVANVAESDVTIAYTPARRLNYTMTKDGVQYEANTYLMMTDHMEAVTFTFAYPDEMPRYFEESMTAIVNSIKRWD